MGTGIRFRHSCDRQGRAPNPAQKDQEDADSRSAETQVLCSPRALSTTCKKRSRCDTGKGVGRRRQAAWGPRLEEGCGREPPGVPTVPAHPGQGAAGTPNLEKPRGRRAASVPSQRARKKVALSRRHPLDSRQKPTEKRHTSSSGVSVGWRGKRPSTSPSSSWEPREHSRQPPGRAAGGAKGGPHPWPCRDTQEVL